ncbi:MAG TPA: hypothetical protein VEM39_06995 [Myxococcaceae bacterium]|nr:hypothetical protein [Myxococcaceae bacterium]
MRRQDDEQTRSISSPSRPSQGELREWTLSIFDLAAMMNYHEAKDRVIADFERLYFAEVMRASGFDMGVAGQKTRLSMQSLYRLLKKNGLRLKELKSSRFEK